MSQAYNNAQSNQRLNSLTLDAFEDVENLSPEDINQRFICVERGNANYVLQPQGYVALPGDVTFANGRVGALQVDGVVYARQFGVVGDGVTDDYAALNDALTRADGLPVNISGLDILVSQEIVLTSEGQALIGDNPGSFFDGTAGYKTRIASTNALGAVIRVQIENCTIDGILIDSAGVRVGAPSNSTAANYNCGIRVEGEDVPAPEGDVFATRILNTRVINQPNDGVVMVGRCFSSEINNFRFTDNGGNGLVITNGEVTGRTNTTIPGIVNLIKGQCNGNQGHGFRVGSNNDTDYAFRVTSINCEGLQNGGTPALLEQVSDSFIHCDGFVGLNATFTGEDANGTSKALSGVSLMGQGGSLIEPRLLDVDEPIRLIKHPSRDSQGWTITNPHLRDGATSTYYVYLDAGVEKVNLWFGDDVGGLTSATNITGTSGLQYVFNGESFSNLTTRIVGSILDSNGLNIASDNRDNISVTTTPTTILDASTSGKMWRISGRHTGDPCLSSFTCDVVGGSTPVVTNVINQSGASVTYSITVLGTDIQAATSAGTRSSDIFINEIVTG